MGRHVPGQDPNGDEDVWRRHKDPDKGEHFWYNAYRSMSFWESDQNSDWEQFRTLEGELWWLHRQTNDHFLEVDGVHHCSKAASPAVAHDPPTVAHGPPIEEPDPQPESPDPPVDTQEDAAGERPEQGGEEDHCRANQAQWVQALQLLVAYLRKRGYLRGHPDVAEGEKELVQALQAMVPAVQLEFLVAAVVSDAGALLDQWRELTSTDSPQHQPFELLVRFLSHALLTCPERIAALNTSRNWTPFQHAVLEFARERAATSNPPSAEAHLGADLLRKLVGEMQQELIEIQKTRRSLERHEQALRTRLSGFERILAGLEGGQHQETTQA